MLRMNLPALLAGTIYRTRGFEYLEFSSAKLHREVSGEDTAILRLRLANNTTLEIPISDEDLQHHMRVLMTAYPKQAMAFYDEHFAPRRKAD